MKQLSTLDKYNALMTASQGVVTREVKNLVFATVVDNFKEDPLFVTEGSDQDYLDMLLKLENGAGDRVGPFRGPFQFGRSAWLEAGEGSWEQNSDDFMLASRAALRYYYLNKNRFQKVFPGATYTNEIAYLYHNQGPSGAKHFLLKGHLKWPLQSKAALRLFDTIELVTT